MNLAKRVFNSLENYLLAFFMAAIVVIVFLQVVFRQLGQSLSWSEELARYLLVWITLIGASQGVKRASHVGVEAFALLLPPKARKAVDIVASALCLLFWALIEYHSLSILRLQIANNQLSPAMRVPIWMAYAALPTGAALMIVRYFQGITRLALNKDAVDLEG
ncbi:MAG: TRAP transporter small permease [Synergistaceae bacterium]|jgi:C4-dicarboxylate transporter DctQ subunit|nr:TRAP transporter small permease [Synergistaceae bacterium]